MNERNKDFTVLVLRKLIARIQISILWLDRMLIDTGNVGAGIGALARSINPPIVLAGSGVGNLAALLSSAYLTNS